MKLILIMQQNPFFFEKKRAGKAFFYKKNLSLQIYYIPAWTHLHIDNSVKERYYNDH